MKIGFDDVMGIHQASLDVRTAKAELISSNLAHADTPGYQAKDIDFREVLAQYSQNKQQASSGGLSSAENYKQNVNDYVKFRNQLHPSIDGNTVTPHMEYTHFAENTQRYMASLTFLTDSIQTMMSAIKGDR